MDAKQILEEIRDLQYRMAEERGFKRLSKEEEKPFREWKVQRYTEAIAIDPNLGEAYAERGSELYFLGRRDEARADMRKAYALRPHDPELYMEMSFPFDGEEKRDILRAGMALVDRASSEHGWIYEHLYADLIRSYWYEGNFAEHLRLLQEWIPQLDKRERMYRFALHDLAMTHSALGSHAEAEAAYRGMLAVSDPDERRHTAEMVIRTLMHRDDYKSARAALKEFAADLPAYTSTIFNAALAVLLAPQSPQTREVSNAALAVAEEQGRLPGPTGKTTSYYSFLLGLIYKGAGKDGQAKELLARFAGESAANKKEWGITMRWEIAKARELSA